MKRRLLSAFLVVCMMLTMIPSVAFAADGEGEPGTTLPPETCTVEYKEQSEGVEYIGAEYVEKDTYILNFEITEDAPSDGLVIDLGSAMMSALSEGGSVMPGDAFKYQVQITNNSGRTYTYKDGSLVISTSDTDDFGSLEEGSLLPVLGYDGQYLPISFAGHMLPGFFGFGTSFEELCQVYDYLEEQGYTGENALTRYMLNTLNEEHGTEYTSLADLVIEHPTWLSTSSGVEHNGIYTMSETELLSYIEQYPWIDKFVYAKSDGDQLDVQIKWPEGELAAATYDAFYQQLLSFVFGKENVERLDPNPGDLDFARAHGIGQYQNGSTLYEEANQYFKDLMANGLQDDATLELDLAWGLDGPTSNMYQNYEFSFYNVIELEEVKPLEPGEGNWKVSKSKTATPLDSNYQSKVTLSLPAADYEKSMDVVFVLDDTHAGSGIFAEAATTLLDELVSKKNLDIHVGIVSFDAAARDWLAATSDTYSGLVSLKDENAVEALKVAIGTELSSDGEGYQKRLGGTNTEWPLAMAQEMLSQGTGGEQHVIMFSDMYGYVYRGNLEVDGKTYENVPLSKINSGYELGQLCIAGPMYKSWEEVYNGQDEDKPEYDVFFRYRSGGSTASWDNYWTTFQGFDTAPTAPNKEDIVTTVWGETYFTPFEKSSCLTYDQVQELLANDVQVTIVNNNFDPGSAEIQTIKNQMLDALDNQGVEVIREDTANGSEFTSDQMSQVFATLEDKLIQLVDAGSRVEDVIGSDTDNKGAEYNFDFVDDASALQLTVGGVPYIVKPNTPESTENETACYLFLESQTAENASFVLHYYEKGKNGNSDECFVWDINVPVTKDMPVQLTYTVELMKPSEVSGTHGQYDEDGHAQYDSLKTNLEAILYPVDSNGTAGRPEKFYTPTVSYTVGAISIEPADITIYTGGDGYESAVEGSGDSEVGKTSNGLPEPGFYITLPDDVNQALIEKVEKTDPDDVTEVEIEENGTTVKQKVVDLSKYLKFTYEDEEGNKRLWELDRYDNQQGNTSMAYSRYIYRIKPSTIQDGEPIPIRLQFTDQENNISTTDDFEVNLDGLYQKYTMTIYAGDLNRGLVKAVVTVPGQEAEEYQAEVLEGDLTIRGVTDQNTMTTDVVKNENGPTEAVEDITAHVPEEAKFYINESQLEVADPESVKLLVDSIVEDENNTLHNEAIDEFAEITADHNVQLNYLDLVDESNGNAWVTTGKQPITVYWPYPEGTDKNDDFYIVHYEGLDRNDNEALENDRYTMELYSKDSKENGLETTDQGIRITVDSFSPFALFWEEDDIPVIDEPDGGDEDPIRYTLTYVSNGGTEYDPERYNANTVVQIDKQPIREGYTFEGWYLDEELTEPVDEVKMTRNITVYAKWEPTSVPGDLNGDDHFAYIIGRDDGYIHPTDNINRAEVAAIFFRLLKEDVRQANLTDTHSFNDVDADMWYNTSVATMAKMGIVTGDPDGSFRPEDSITRAEFAAIAARFDEIAYDGEDLFSDIAGHWAQEEINAAANNGWILGYTDGTFGPQKYITRAEAMTLVNRVLNRLPEDTSDLLDDMIRWPDNQDTNIWYYLAVQEATNSHDYERKSDGVHEKWTALNENEDWVKYQ